VEWVLPRHDEVRRPSGLLRRRRCEEWVAGRVERALPLLGVCGGGLRRAMDEEVRRPKRSFSSLATTCTGPISGYRFHPCTMYLHTQLCTRHIHVPGGGGGECGYCRKQNRSTRHGVLRTSAREVAAYSSQSRTDGPAQLRTRGPGPNRRMQKRVAGCQTRAPRVSPDDARLAPPPMHRCPSPFPDADARTITKSV